MLTLKNLSNRLRKNFHLYLVIISAEVKWCIYVCIYIVVRNGVHGGLGNKAEYIIRLCHRVATVNRRPKTVSDRKHWSKSKLTYVFFVRVIFDLNLISHRRFYRRTRRRNARIGLSLKEEINILEILKLNAVTI